MELLVLSSLNEKNGPRAKRVVFCLHNYVPSIGSVKNFFLALGHFLRNFALEFQAWSSMSEK
jgi:hypothetical protein